MSPCVSTYLKLELLSLTGSSPSATRSGEGVSTYLKLELLSPIPGYSLTEGCERFHLFEAGAFVTDDSASSLLRPRAFPPI